MPTRAQLEDALIKAHSAGDTEAATMFAGMIKSGEYDAMPAATPTADAAAFFGGDTGTKPPAEVQASVEAQGGGFQTEEMLKKLVKHGGKALGQIGEGVEQYSNMGPMAGGLIAGDAAQGLVGGALTALPAGADAVQKFARMGMGKLGLTDETAADVNLSTYWSDLSGSNAMMESFEKNNPVAAGTIGLMSAPFIAPVEQLTEDYGPAAGITGEFALTVLPVIGGLARAAKGTRAPYTPTKTPEAPTGSPSPLSEALGNAIGKKDKPEAGGPTTPDMEMGGVSGDTPWMPVDVARTLQLQNDQRGGVVLRDMVEDMAKEATDDYKRLREAKEAEGPGKDIEAEMAWRQKEQADQAWKELTEDESWTQQEKMFPDQFEKLDDRQLASAMEEAVRELAAKEKAAMEMAGTDPVLAPSKLVAVSSIFARAMKRAQGGWVDFWGERHTPKMGENTAALVAEDTRRGAAARWRLWSEAVDADTTLSADSRGVDGGALMWDTTTSINKAKALTKEGKQAMQLATRFVQEALPRMFSLATEGIHILDFKKVHQFTQEAAAMRTIGGSSKDILRMLQKDHPELWNVVKNANDPLKVAESMDLMDKHGNPVGAQAREWTVGKIDNKGRAIMVDQNFINSLARDPVRLASMLVHEYAHLFHYNLPWNKMKVIRDQVNDVPYWDKWTEKYARQAEESANVKFHSLFGDELRKMGYDVPELAPLWHKKGAQTPRTFEVLRGKGLGPGRALRGKDAPTPQALRGGLTLAESKRAQAGLRKNQGGYVDFGLLDAGERLFTGIKEWWSKERNPPNELSKLAADFPDMTTEQLTNVVGSIDVDIKPTIGLRTGTFAGITPAMKVGPRQKAYVAALHFLNKVKKAVANEHALNYDHIKKFETFEKHYGLGKGLGVKKHHQEAFAKDVAIALRFERKPNEWFNGKDWYPNDQQLIDAGMSPDSARVWRSAFDEMELLWERLDETAKANGTKPVPRIPGYLPHEISGPYRVQAYRLRKNGEKQYVMDLGANNMREATALRDLAKKHLAGEPDIILDNVVKPTPGKRDVGGMLEQLRRARDAAGNMEGLAKLTQIIEENAAKSIISHALQRSHPTKFGHTLERAAAFGDDFGLASKDMTKAIEIFRDYARAVNGWTERSRLVRETLGPMDAAGYFDHPNLHRLAMDYFKSYTRIQGVHLMDTVVKDFMVSMGMNPNGPGNAVHAMQGAFAKYYLWANIPFYVVNSAQSLASFPVLLGAASRLRLAGGTPPNLAVVAARGSARLKNAFTEGGFTRDPALEWAKKHGFLDPQAIEAVDPAQFQDKITQLIDTRTRRISFIYGHEFWKAAGKTGEEALRLAGEFANEVSVPYSQQIGAPSLLTKIPAFGRAAAMFTTYPVHIMSMLENNLKVTVQAIRQKNPKAALEGLGAMTSFAGMQLALFGTMAVPFAAAFDKIMELINDFYGKPVVPTMKEVGRKIDNAVGAKGLTEFGVISSVTGWDISGSASGVMPQVPTAFSRGAQTLFEAALLSGRWLGSTVGMDTKPTKQEVYDVARQLPPVYRGMAEWLIKDFPRYSSRQSPHEKGESRTKTQQIMAILGIKSTEERAGEYTERLDKLNEQRITARFSRLSEQFKDNGLTPELADKLIEISMEYKRDPMAVLNAYQTFLENQQLSPIERRAKKALSSGDFGRFQRYQELQQQETTR